jgi:hypothetical protein
MRNWFLPPRHTRPEGSPRRAHVPSYMTAVGFFGAGALVPGGLGLAGIVGHVDGPLAIASVLIAGACFVGAPMLLRVLAKPHHAAVTFVVGVFTAGLVLYLFWTPIADWYFVKRCRDGRADACEQAFRQGFANSEASDFYAPRRACALGKPAGCAFMLKRGGTYEAETCASLRLICDDPQAQAAAQACSMVRSQCDSGSTPTEGNH